MKQLHSTLSHLWRNKLFTALNILGLAIGISASWIIYHMVSFEFSYNRHELDRERIFQLTSSSKIDDGRGEEMASIGAIVIALLTVSYQAIRAARANPVNSLRNE